MAKRDLLRLPDDFEANLRALLNTPPAPHGTAGSRKAAPKPPAKPKARKAHRRTKAEAAAHREALAQGVRYEYERAPVVSQRSKKAARKKAR